MGIVTKEQASRSVQLGAVADKHRRQTLRILQNAGESLSFADLAIELVRQESPHETIGAECERVEEMLVALHHNHVPNLTSAGLVDLDVNRELVTTTEAGVELITLVDRMLRSFE